MQQAKELIHGGGAKVVCDSQQQEPRKDTKFCHHTGIWVIEMSETTSVQSKSKEYGKVLVVKLVIDDKSVIRDIRCPAAYNLHGNNYLIFWLVELPLPGSFVVLIP